MFSQFCKAYILLFFLMCKDQYVCIDASPLQLTQEMDLKYTKYYRIETPQTEEDTENR